jgi:16S rRNA (uracil1498-N3)-methyltransferase
LPKGDRLDRMLDQLTQLGVSVFRPLLCEHAQRKPETIRIDKLDRIVEESMKQCRRAWRLEIGDPIQLEDALGNPDAMVADASGEVWDACRDGAPNRVLIVGPEGGWSNSERELFVETGVRVRRFGIFVMRIEAAAAAASAFAMCASVNAE